MNKNKRNVSYIQGKSYSAQATTYNSNTQGLTVCTTPYLQFIFVQRTENGSFHNSSDRQTVYIAQQQQQFDCFRV